MTGSQAGKSSAVAAVAGEVLGAHTAAPAPAAEGDLFAELDAEAELLEGATIRPPARRGAGRPPGSPNRTTLQLQRWLRARGYRDPAEFLAAVVSQDTAQLARELGEVGEAGDPSKVLALQIRAAGELMPYFHQAMPKQVHVQGDAPRTLVVINDTPAGAMRQALEASVMSAHEVQQTQPLSPSAAPASDDEASDGERQAIDPQA